jgi:hypothetical protein
VAASLRCSRARAPLFGDGATDDAGAASATFPAALVEDAFALVVAAAAAVAAADVSKLFPT